MNSKISRNYSRADKTPAAAIFDTRSSLTESRKADVANSLPLGKWIIKRGGHALFLAFGLCHFHHSRKQSFSFHFFAQHLVPSLKFRHSDRMLINHRFQRSNKRKRDPDRD